MSSVSQSIPPVCVSYFDNASRDLFSVSLVLGFAAGRILGGSIKHIVTLLALAAASVVAGGCAVTPDDSLLASSEVVRQLSREEGERIEVARFSRKVAGGALPDYWQPYIILPSKPRTGYALVQTDDGVALEASADRSASGKVRRIRIDPQQHQLLEWRWRVGNLIPGADKRFAGTDDSPARLVVSFHGDEKKLDFQHRMQMRMARALSGQSLPYATLMYVWSDTLPVGTVIENPHTDRIRAIVVAGGAEGVGQWREYRRNVLEDYRMAFGEEPWDIVAVGVMTDTDNTSQKARCLYGDITFLKGR